MSLDVTGDIIKSAIARKLVEVFTVDGIKPVVYKEQIKQKFTYPSFFIWQIEVLQKKRMNGVYDREYMMEVRYALKEDDVRAYEKLDEIGNKLLLNLTSIQVPIATEKIDGKYTEGIRQVKVKGDIEIKKDENILLATMTYPITIVKTEDEIKLRDYIYTEKVI